MRPQILCAVGDDERSPSVVQTARSIAERAAFDVVYVHVSEPALPAAGSAPMHPAAGVLPPESQAGADERGMRVLAEAGVQPADRPIVRRGDPAREIRRLAADLGVELIVAGANRSGALAAALLGSVSRQLVRESPAPVILGHGARLPLLTGPIVCGIENADAASRAAAVNAGRLARRLMVPLILVHVRTTIASVPNAPVPPITAEGAEEVASARDILAVLGSDLDGVAPETVIADGDVVAELERVADERQASLIAVGSHGDGPLRAALLRAVPVDLTRRTMRPLMVVPDTLAA